LFTLLDCNLYVKDIEQRNTVDRRLSVRSSLNKHVLRVWGCFGIEGNLKRRLINWLPCY